MSWTERLIDALIGGGIVFCGVMTFHSAIVNDHKHQKTCGDLEVVTAFEENSWHYVVCSPGISSDNYNSETHGYTFVIREVKDK